MDSERNMVQMQNRTAGRNKEHPKKQMYPKLSLRYMWDKLGDWLQHVVSAVANTDFFKCNFK